MVGVGNGVEAVVSVAVGLGLDAGAGIWLRVVLAVRVGVATNGVEKVGISAAAGVLVGVEVGIAFGCGVRAGSGAGSEEHATPNERPSASRSIGRSFTALLVLWDSRGLSLIDSYYRASNVLTPLYA